MATPGVGWGRNAKSSMAKSKRDTKARSNSVSGAPAAPHGSDSTPPGLSRKAKKRLRREQERRQSTSQPPQADVDSAADVVDPDSDTADEYSGAEPASLTAADRPNDVVGPGDDSGAKESPPVSQVPDERPVLNAVTVHPPSVRVGESPDAKVVVASRTPSSPDAGDVVRHSQVPVGAGSSGTEPIHVLRSRQGPMLPPPQGGAASEAAPVRPAASSASRPSQIPPALERIVQASAEAGARASVAPPRPSSAPAAGFQRPTSILDARPSVAPDSLPAPGGIGWGALAGIAAMAAIVAAAAVIAIRERVARREAAEAAVVQEAAVHPSWPVEEPEAAAAPAPVPEEVQEPDASAVETERSAVLSNVPASAEAAHARATDSPDRAQTASDSQELSPPNTTDAGPAADSSAASSAKPVHAAEKPSEDSASAADPHRAPATVAPTTTKPAVVPSVVPAAVAKPVVVPVASKPTGKTPFADGGAAPAPVPFELPPDPYADPSPANP
jgi:hypothetical protein